MPYASQLAYVADQIPPNWATLTVWSRCVLFHLTNSQPRSIPSSAESLSSSYLNYNTENRTGSPILQSLDPFPARSSEYINEINSLNTSRHCFIKYRIFIKLWINARARSPASKFQPDLEQVSGAVQQFPADGQMPFGFPPSAELSESFLAYHQSGNVSMNRMLLPLILPPPISTPRFCL